MVCLNLDRIQIFFFARSLKQLFEKGNVVSTKVFPYFLKSIKYVSNTGLLYVAINCDVPNLDFGLAGNTTVVK